MDLPDPPPGISEAYDIASKKLDDQLALVDSTDAKLGIALTLLALGSGFLSAAAAPPWWARIVIGGFLLVGVVSAGMEFMTSRGDLLDAPSPEAVRDLAALLPDQAKMVLIENVVAAFQANQPLLRRKNQRLVITIAALSTNLVFALGLRAFGQL